MFWITTCQCNLGKQELRVFPNTSLALRCEKAIAKQQEQALAVKILDEEVTLSHSFLLQKEISCMLFTK